MTSPSDNHPVWQAITIGAAVTAVMLLLLFGAMALFQGLATTSTLCP
ncbi:hypothetical protein JK358_04635 [Nocardia sp. 2]|uniref:Uncharacterized protein n=1 Tax=Nocardia acididurans TaxID=2802282 RepID=A0ABS1LZ28_9NOCA|nr:hypothetical protein [Nocardia acididurans]MBL1073672.1 hypothetical protein [Nocardia acididurans]